MFDPALGVRIVLAPKPDKLVKMVGAQDGPVPGVQTKQIWSLTLFYPVGFFFTIKDQWKSVIFNREQYLHKLYPDGVVTVLPLYPGKRDSVFVSLQSKIQRGGQV